MWDKGEKCAAEPDIIPAERDSRGRDRKHRSRLRCGGAWLRRGGRQRSFCAAWGQRRKLAAGGPRHLQRCRDREVRQQNKRGNLLSDAGLRTAYALGLCTSGQVLGMVAEVLNKQLTAPTMSTQWRLPTNIQAVNQRALVRAAK